LQIRELGAVAGSDDLLHREMIPLAEALDDRNGVRAAGTRDNDPVGTGLFTELLVHRFVGSQIRVVVAERVMGAGEDVPMEDTVEVETHHRPGVVLGPRAKSQDGT